MPFLSGWNYRKAIKYGTTKPGSNLTSFPTLLKIVADTDIGAVLSSRKFAVTDTDGTTQLAYGNYNDFAVPGGSCTFTLRFKQTLSSSAATGDVIGYLYYDQSQTDQANRAGVCGSELLAFWPMEEDPSGSAPQIVDWAGNNNATSYGTWTSGQLVSAEVVKGLNFDGSTDAQRFSGVAIGTDWTVMTWSQQTTAGVNGTILDVGNARVRFKNGVFNYIITNIVEYSAGTSNSTTMNHLAVSKDETGNTLDFYFNGSGDGNYTSVTDAGSATVSNIGAFDFAGGPFEFLGGILDELQLWSPRRSADWIAYAYQNDKNNSDTVTLGTQETAPAGGGLWLIKA